MVHVNMGKSTGRELTPGIDLWEVMSMEAGKSQAGDAKLSAKFSRVANPSDHMYDTIMLAGGGWDIGKPKLVALGVPEDLDGDLDTLSLLGVRVWISTGIETYQGKDRMKVLIDDLSHKGYQPAAQVPPGCVMPEEPAQDEPPF